MKTNDPKLTSFVLGELNAEESREVQQAMIADPAIAAEIALIEESCDTIKQGYANQTPQLNATQRGKVFAANDEATPTNIVSINEKGWLPWAGAVGAAAAAIIAIAYFAEPGSSIVSGPNFAAMSETPLTQRLALQATPWNVTSTQTSEVSITKDSLNITNHPKQYQAFTAQSKATLKTPSQVTSTSSWIGTSDQSSTTLPLVSANFSWNWIQKNAKNLNDTNRGIIRTEEIINHNHLKFTPDLTINGVDAKVSTTVSPWNEQSIVAVIQLHNPTTKTVKDLSAGITVGEDVKQFRVIGYSDPSSNSTLINTKVNAESGYSHTLLVELELDQPISDIDTLFSLHLRTGSDNQQGTYGFAPDETPDQSAEVFVGLAFWSQWQAQSPAVSASQPSEIKAYLDRVLETTSDKTARTMLEEAITNL